MKKMVEILFSRTCHRTVALCNTDGINIVVLSTDFVTSLVEILKFSRTCHRTLYIYLTANADIFPIVVRFSVSNNNDEDKKTI